MCLQKCEGHWGSASRVTFHKIQNVELLKIPCHTQLLSLPGFTINWQYGANSTRSTLPTMFIVFSRRAEDAPRLPTIFAMISGPGLHKHPRYTRLNLTVSHPALVPLASGAPSPLQAHLSTPWPTFRKQKPTPAAPAPELHRNRRRPTTPNLSRRWQMAEVVLPSNSHDVEIAQNRSRFLLHIRKRTLLVFLFRGNLTSPSALSCNRLCWSSRSLARCE